MNKQGKFKYLSGWTILLAAIVVVGTFSYFSDNGITGALGKLLGGQNAGQTTQTSQYITSPPPGTVDLTPSQADAALKNFECGNGNTQFTTMRFTQTNLINKSATGSGVQQFDTGLYCYNSNKNKEMVSYSGIIVSNTQGASQASAFGCGQDFLCKPLTVNANPGNSSRIFSLTKSDVPAEVTPEGWLWFHTKGPSATVEFGGKQLGRFQAKFYSGLNGLPLYDGGDNSYDDWEASGANVTGTANNNTCTSIGSSDTFSVCVQLQSSLEYTDPTDRGVYAGWKLNTSMWEVPTAKLGGITGATIPNIKGSLPEAEASAYGSTTDGYDYVYKLDGPMDQDNTKVLCLTTKPKSGMNPADGATNDPRLYLEPIGSYVSNKGSANNIVEGARQNNPANTVVGTAANYRFCLT